MRDQGLHLHIRVVGALHVLEASLYIGCALLIIIFFSGLGLMAKEPEAFGILSIFGFIGGGFLLIFGVPVAIAGWGLLNRISWSRVLAMVLAILGLFLFPIGTLVGIYFLWVLTSTPAGTYFGDVTGTTSPADSPTA